jgi:hypothetical protein
MGVNSSYLPDNFWHFSNTRCWKVYPNLGGKHMGFQQYMYCIRIPTLWDFFKNLEVFEPEHVLQSFFRTHGGKVVLPARQFQAFFEYLVLESFSKPWVVIRVNSNTRKQVSFFGKQYMSLVYMTFPHIRIPTLWDFFGNLGAFDPRSPLGTLSPTNLDMTGHFARTQSHCEILASDVHFG